MGELYWDSNAKHLHFISKGGPLILQNGTDELVGIGTIKPQAKLDVAGTVKATAFQGDGSGLTNITTKKYGKVAVVAQSGGDYNDPAVAMQNTTVWCGTPSSTNRCLLKIMPECVQRFF